MTSLDVHILVLDSTVQQELDRAVASVELAASKTSMEVNVHVVEGIPTHLGRSRERGYSVGVAEYVTHCDHDDYFHPDALVKVERYLKKGLRAITTGEYVVAGSKEIPMPNSAHHIAVFKRDWLVMQDYADYKFFPDQRLIEIARPYHIRECLYYHVVHEDSASRKQRAAYRKDSAAEASRIQRRLMQVEHLSNFEIAKLIDKELGDG